VGNGAPRNVPGVLSLNLLFWRTTPVMGIVDVIGCWSPVDNVGAVQTTGGGGSHHRRPATVEEIGGEIVILLGHFSPFYWWILEPTLAGRSSPDRYEMRYEGDFSRTFLAHFREHTFVSALG